MIQAFLFTASTDFVYKIFIITIDEFMNVVVRALIKSRVPGPHIEKSGCRLVKWRATF